MFSNLVEAYYAQKLYPLLASKISQATGIFPFSLAELIIIGSSLLLISTLLKLLLRLVTGTFSLFSLIQFLLKSLAGIAALYVLFLLFWGLNYHRLPYSKISGIEVSSVTSSELEGLCSYLVEKTNELRGLVEEDSSGFMKVPSPRDVLRRAPLGYEEAAKDHPQLAGSYAQPKAVFLSRAMSYLGIWGVYFPFTAEANVNMAIPNSQLPSIVCHEMAHQRGFAREDEANYIAYLTCQYHPDVDFKYSGSLLALLHSMRALQNQNPQAAARLKSYYSSGVKRDLVQLYQFSQKHQGPLQDLSTEINNYYLKANNQKDGVQSYGRMVDLLIAEYRQKLKNEFK